MRKFGLIGYPLGHSFSERYFKEKFAAEGITDAAYQLFELPRISLFPDLLASEPDLIGLNVTIPYKESIIPYLDAVAPEAAGIGAVNVLKITAKGITGYNSDYQGFMQSLEHFYPCYSPSGALVLGTGGASKAVQAALRQLEIPFQVVSRNPGSQVLTYEQLTPAVMASSALIINTTPLGTFPNTESAPPIPYQLLSPHHYLYDLVYNPAETRFMRLGMAAGAKVKNGYEMLCLQAEVSWQIWNDR